MGPARVHPSLVRTFPQLTPAGSRRYLKIDLEIRGIYLPYIGFFAVLGLFEGALKPYHPLAALITGIVGNFTGIERPGIYDNGSEMVRFQ